jgi:hypothetical protein
MENTRKIKANWSDEQEQDLAAYHGVVENLNSALEKIRQDSSYLNQISVEEAEKEWARILISKRYSKDLIRHDFFGVVKVSGEQVI